MKPKLETRTNYAIEIVDGTVFERGIRTYHVNNREVSHEEYQRVVEDERKKSLPSDTERDRM